MQEPPERELIKYHGVQIEVLLRGRGPLIVMLPSGGRGAEDFDAVAARLAAEGFRVACPQPRGIGASTGPMSGISLHDLANDVAAVIRHEGGAPAVVVGHAYGNWVARMIAADHPELVRGTVIAAAGIKDYPKDIADAVVRCAQPNLPKQERLASLRIAFFAPGNDPSVWLGGWYPEVMLAAPGQPRNQPRRILEGRQGAAARPAGGRRPIPPARLAPGHPARTGRRSGNRRGHSQRQPQPDARATGSHRQSNRRMGQIFRRSLGGNRVGPAARGAG